MSNDDAPETRDRWFVKAMEPGDVHGPYFSGDVLDYKILFAPTREGLEKAVREAIRNRWRPLGAHTYAGEVYEQAMGRQNLEHFVDQFAKAQAVAYVQMQADEWNRKRQEEENRRDAELAEQIRRVSR